MKINRQRFLTVVSIFLICHNLSAQPQYGEYSLFLTHTLETNSNFWIRVHAAEALSLNNFTVDAKQVFKEELNKYALENIGALNRGWLVYNPSRPRGNFTSRIRFPPISY